MKQKPLEDSIFQFVPRSLPKSVRLLAMIAGLALASTGELEPPLLVVFLTLYLFGFKIEVFPRLAKLMGFLQPTLATLIFLVAVVDFFFLSQSFLLVVAHFLLCLQGLRLLALRTTRENLGSILLSSLMILSASTLAVEWTFFVMLFIFLPTIIWTLIIYNLVAENQMAAKASAQLNNKGLQSIDPDVVGLLRERSMFWKRMMPVVRQSSLIAFMVAVFCCTVVFIIIPRFNFQGFRGRFLQPVHKSGFSNKVDLNKSGQIYEDDSIVMRIEIKPEDRKKWSGYLRGAVLDRFDGQVWTASTRKDQRLYRSGSGVTRIPSGYRGGGERLPQRIYLESMESPVLFAASKPIFLKIDRPFIFLGADESLRRAFNDSWRIRYEVLSLIQKPFEKDLSQEFKKRKYVGYGGIPQKYTELENYDLDIEELANDVTEGAGNPLGRAEKISRYLQSQFKYSTNLQLNNRENPLHDFLFEFKSGHCEYFASAMSVMLRSVGVPSRMVTGFYSEEWNERGHYVVVRMKHAHSWVEAYIEPYGWVEFDPAPLVWRDPLISSDFMNRIMELKDFLNLRWNRYILSYDIERQVNIVRSINRRSQNVSIRLDRLFGAFRGSFDWYKSLISGNRNAEIRRGTSMFLAPVAVIASVLLVLLLLRYFLAPRRGRSSIWFYESFLKILEAKGGHKSNNQTLNEYVRKTAALWKAQLVDIQFLCRTYYAYRFNPRPLTPAGEKQAIKQALLRLRQST